MAVFFQDDNFVVDKRRTGALLRAMAAQGLTPLFGAQMRADTVLASRRSKGRTLEVDHDFLQLLNDAGCRMTMIGFESVSERNLKSIGKKTSVDVGEAAVPAFHVNGIAVHGMFVVGLEYDDAESARATADFARRLDIDTFQLMMVTPIPGTRLWDRVRAEGRLVDAEWTLFDGHHAVLRPERMTPLQLQLTTMQAMRRFYSASAIVRLAIRGVLSHLPQLLAIAARHGTGLLAALDGKTLRAGRRRLASAEGAGTSDGAVEGDSALARAIVRVSPSLSRDEHARIEAALGIAALRLYGRRRLAEFSAQPHSRAHIARLQSLA